MPVVGEPTAEFSLFQQKRIMHLIDQKILKHVTIRDTKQIEKGYLPSMAIDIAVMKSRLEAKRKELLESISELTEAQPELVDPTATGEGSQDFEEAAIDVTEMEDERALRENERELLNEVEQALERIKQGTYGICTNCGRPIDERRLEALPWASLCIVCEGELEQSNR